MPHEVVGTSNKSQISETSHVIIRINFTYLFFSLADQVGVELDFSKALNRLGETAFTREDVGDFGSDDIGAAFQKFSVVTKELSNLMKNLVSRGTSN